MKQIVVFIIGALIVQQQALAQTKQAPVIIIMCDQLRYDAIGEYTPHINELKADGVSFNRTYCASPLCAPSRAAFFTGKYPNDNGCLINGWQDEDAHYGEVKSGTLNMYGLLGDNWNSRHIGKQHFVTQDKIDKDPQSKTKWITPQTYKQWVKSVNEKAPGGPQFKAMLPELVSNKYTQYKNYSTPKYDVYKPGLQYFDDNYYTDKAIETINESKHDKKPLFLSLMYLSPHPPFDVPEPYYSKFKPEDFAIPDNIGEWYAGQSTLQLYNLTGFIGTRYTKEQWKQVWPKYFGLVSLVDDEIGRVIDALKTNGLYDKALIIFTSDHGEMLGSHSLWQKMCMYEESARVPFIIKFPSDYKPALKEVNDNVSLIDVWPTLIDYLDIDNAGNTDGQSLMPLLQGKATGRKNVFIQYDGNGAYGNNQRCIVEGDYKLIIDTFKDEVFIELYNLSTDPLEKNNLAVNIKYEAIVNQLIEKVKKHMSDTNDLLKLPDNIYQNFVTHYTTSNKSSSGD
ncbi:sulfatase family protein [Parafilimonas terrae]|uniref:Choline-sulfatase n=1 Tax=Parafilimonas terrae TaxID=1465490 RepID=A0A1I5Y1X1_9BACT|nr:sulfatase-like hydrolase/transferase [Parafilimonas terrae]SFQ38251.1 choline-sulfatase [Parafilimonas terrae]